MRKLWSLVMGLVFVLSATGADGPTTVSPDFKLQINGYALSNDPITQEEIVSRNGLIYHFAADTKEVVIIDSVKERLEILDLGRKIQTDITFRQIEDGLVKVKASLKATIDDRTSKGGRANLVEAEMTGDLLEPKLKARFDDKANRVRLTNPTVEVDASGEPDPDAARLGLIDLTLKTIAKFGSYRTPNDLPPFVELEAINALSVEHKLRATEIVYLYRLAGPPRKFRRTYRMIPSLTDRDIEALFRIDRLKQTAPYVRYERYRVR